MAFAIKMDLSRSPWLKTILSTVLPFFCDQQLVQLSINRFHSNHRRVKIDLFLRKFDDFIDLQLLWIIIWKILINYYSWNWLKNSAMFVSVIIILTTVFSCTDFDDNRICSSNLFNFVFTSPINELVVLARSRSKISKTWMRKV